MSKHIDMSTAMDALRADRDAVVEIGRRLDPAQWASPSGCEGWTTKDLVSHLASLFWSAVDGTAGPDTTGLGLEEAAAVKVEARRSLSPAEVIADYEAVSLRALDALAVLATLDMDIPFSDTEHYPASVVPLAFCFDHYVHLRTDLFAPRGSLEGPAPASDQAHLLPTLEWIHTAIPQQNAARLASLEGRVDLVVTGPAARTIAIGQGDPVATVESDGHTLVRWITGRADWSELDVRTEGSASALGTARSLKVY